MAPEYDEDIGEWQFAPLADAVMSTRTINALHRSQIFTVSDLRTLRRPDILGTVEGVGEVGWREIKAFLASLEE